MTHPCRHAKHAADAHRESRLLAAALTAFKRPLGIKPLAEACLRRLLSHQLAASWAAWREHVQASHQLAAAAADRGRAVVQRWRSQLLASALSSWLQYAARSQRLRQVLRRIQQRQLLAALRTWRERTTSMQRARELMRRSLWGTQQWAFAAWREVVAEAAEQRWALEQVAAAEGQGRPSPKKLVFALQGDHSAALLMHCLDVWRAATAVQRDLRARVLRAYRHLYFSLARRCFAAMR